MELIVNPATVQIPSGFDLPLPTQGKRWTGFYRSETKKAGNRYIAKCRYCLIELSGKPEKLHNHVLRCSDWKPTEKLNIFKKLKKKNLYLINVPMIALMMMKMIHLLSKLAMMIMIMYSNFLLLAKIQFSTSLLVLYLKLSLKSLITSF